MDALTLMVVNLMLLIAMMGAQWYLWRTQRNRLKGVGFWTIGTLFLAIAYVGMILQLVPSVSSLFSVAIPNALMYGACLTFLKGTGIFMERRPPRMVPVAVALLYAWSMVRFLLVENNFFARSVMLALVIMLTFIVALSVIVKSPRPERPVLLLVGVVCVFVTQMIRLVMMFGSVFTPVTTLFDIKAFLLIPTMLDMAALSILTVGLFDIVSRRLQGEEASARRDVEAYRDSLLRVLDDRTEQLLLTTERAYVGDFAAGLGHDMLNPMNNISTSVEALEFGYRAYQKSNRDEIRAELISSIPETAKTVAANVDRVVHLCKEMMNLANPLKGHHRDTVDVLEEVSIVFDLMRNALQQKRIHWQVQKEHAPILVRGNRYWLEQILINCIKNSMDAMEGSGGTITISVEQQAGLVLLSIADNGCGIPEEICQTFGVPYSTTKEHGNGLGLFVVQTLAEKFGGTAMAKRLARGTSITIQLPAWEQES
jgi:signal transduction histidine kinase